MFLQLSLHKSIFLLMASIVTNKVKSKFLLDVYLDSQFLEKLKRQVVDGHHEACWWRHNPFPLHLTQPPQSAVMEDLQNLSNSAHTLGSLESALPHLDIPAHMAQLVRSFQFVIVGVSKLMSIFHDWKRHKLVGN